MRKFDKAYFKKEIKRASLVLITYWVALNSSALSYLLKNVFGLQEHPGVQLCIRLSLPLLVGLVLYYKDLARDADHAYYYHNLANYKDLMSGKKKSNFIWKYLRHMVMWIALAMVLQVVVAMLLEGYDQSLNQQELMEVFTSDFNIFTVISVSVIGPIVEEIVFREIMLRQASYFINEYVAGVISCVLFTLAHCSNWMDFVSYLPITVIITLVYFKEDHLVLNTMLFHVLYNSLVTFIMMQSF